MSVRYNKDFKMEVVKVYMAGDKSTAKLAAEYNIAKSTITEWAKKYFGLRWLCLKFNISTNCYYNYLKNKKYKYYKKLNDIYERIKYIYYTNNRVIGNRIMAVLLYR